MEYTRSKGEHSYETFEGTPEEIAKLINAIDKVEKIPENPFKKLFAGMSPPINTGTINPGTMSTSPTGFVGPVNTYPIDGKITGVNEKWIISPLRGGENEWQEN